MSRLRWLHYQGAHAGSNGADGRNGTVTVDPAPVAMGMDFAGHVGAGISGNDFLQGLAKDVDYYSRAYVVFPGFSNNDTNVFIWQEQGGSFLDLLAFRVNSSGSLRLFTGATQRGSSVSLAANQRYKLELHCKVNSADGSINWDGWVNDVLVAGGTNLAGVGTNLVPYNILGNNGNGSEMYWANWALHDSSRAAHGIAKFLLPISDSAVGSGWTKEGGATTSLFSSVDNRPPQGVADTNASGDAEKQLRNAASNAATDYDAAVQSPNEAGIPAGSLFPFARAEAVVGATVTSALGGALRAVSNPAEGAETSINFNASAIAAAYPTGWIQRRNAIIANPTIVAATRPVVRIGKRLATTNVALVGNMGLAVEYVAPASPAVTTEAASSVGNTAATANGTINPQGQATTYYIELGTTEAYGTQAPVAAPGQSLGFTDTASHAVSYSFTGLTPGTIYHYRVVAINASGTTYGSDRTFLTTGGVSTHLRRVRLAHSNGDFSGGGAILPDAATVAAEQDYVILQGAFRSAAATAIKAANPNCKVLCYVDTPTYSDWGTATPMGGDALSTAQATAIPGAATGVDNPFGVGDKITDLAAGGFGAGGVADRIWLNIRDNILNYNSAWDGIFLDDVDATFGDNATGYTASTWRDNALIPVLQYVVPKIRAMGKLVLGNFGAWGQHRTVNNLVIAQLDGGMDEFHGTWFGGGLQTESEVDQGLTTQDDRVADGKIWLGLTYVGAAETAKAKYGFALGLMGLDSQSTFAHGPSTAGTEWQLPEYNYKFGNPTAARTKPAAGQWRRTFEFGTVTANLTGPTATFAMLAVPTTGAATGLSGSGATLNGSANPQDVSGTTYLFEYGPTGAYGSQTPSTALGSSDHADHAISAAVTGLAPDTLYHFRLVTTNANGTTYGADQTFQTTAAGGGGGAAISPFQAKQWKNAPDTSTPISAEALIDLEQRLADYIDSGPSARVGNDAAISLTNNTDTYLTFNIEKFDNASLHSVATNTSRLTAPRQGRYRTTANVGFAANASGKRTVSLVVNRTRTVARSDHNASSSGETHFSVTADVFLFANDYVEVMVNQNSGGALNVVSAVDYSPYFSLTWIGP